MLNGTSRPPGPQGELSDSEHGLCAQLKGNAGRIMRIGSLEEKDRLVGEAVPDHLIGWYLHRGLR
jgi:hypothetical protein